MLEKSSNLGLSGISFLDVPENDPGSQLSLGKSYPIKHLRTGPSRTLLGNEQTPMKRNLARKK